MAKTLALLLLAAMAFTTGVWASGSGEAAGKQVTVTWWAPNFNDPRSDTLAAKFMKDNPNIKVDVQKTVSAGLQDKILVAIQSGTTPDIIDGQLGLEALIRLIQVIGQSGRAVHAYALKV